MDNKKSYRDNIATILKENPLGLNSAEIARLLKLNLRKTQRILKELKEKKVISQQGKASSIKYVMATALPVTYDFAFLKKLSKPHFLFTKEELKRLEILGKREGSTTNLDTYNVQIYERLIIDLSWSSSKLEGNTYTLLETENLLVENKMVEGKDLQETQMILNHKEAIKFVINNRERISISASSIKSIHALLSDGLIANPQSQGSIRLVPVGIEGSRYLPLDIPQQINDEFSMLLTTVNRLRHPIEQSFLLFFFLPYLQPFEDLNKRTARVACNISLIANNYIPVSFVLTDTKEYIAAIKDVYEETNILNLKNIFISAYVGSVERYRYIKQSLAEPHPFKIKYRNEIRQIINELVINDLSLESLNLNFIPQSDQKDLLKLIQIELNGLHEGNLIKFELTPKQFKKWKSKS